MAKMTRAARVSREQLKDKNFGRFLKKCRKQFSGGMTQVESAKMAGISASQYRAIENGARLPQGYAHAAGLLMVVGTPEAAITKNFFPTRHKPIAAPLQMTDREEALIQWFDDQLEACLSSRCRNKLAAVGVLCFAMEFEWTPWASSTELIAWVEAHTGEKYTKQAISKRREVIRDSFASACKGVAVADRAEVLERIAEKEEEIEKLRTKISA